MNNDLYSFLSWDSELFGYKVAKIKPTGISSSVLQELLEDLKQQGVTLVYWFTDPNDTKSNKAAEDNVGFLADTKVTYTNSLMKYDSQTDSHIHSYTKTIVSDELLSLTLQSGIYSRFRIDPSFVHNEYEKLYTAWITRSVKRDIAKDVQVYTIGTAIVGFITLSKKNGVIDIGLIAVDKNYRGQGIGSKLLNTAIKYAKDWEGTKVSVVTQKQNRNASIFYERKGFIIEKEENIYHFWLQA